MVDHEARATRPAHTRRRMLVLIVAAVLLVAAGIGIGMTALVLPSGAVQSEETVRTRQGIPVHWTADSGERHRCSAWLEIAGAQPGDQDVLDAAIREHRWADVWQRIYDRSTAVDDRDDDFRVLDEIDRVLRDFAERTLPSTPRSHADARMMVGSGYICD